MILKLISALSLLFAALGASLTGGALWCRALAGVGIFLGSWLLLALAAVAVLWVCCDAVDFEKPQEEDSPFYRRLAGLYIEALIGLLRVRIHATGLEKTPKEGRFLLVCNHLFDADPGILLHCFPHSQLAFISKKENKDLPFVGKIMHKILCQLLDREDDRQALRVILKCVELLKLDKCSIAVFPEGYCSRDGKFQNFRPGVFKIALKTKVPIVVCTLRNTKPIVKNGLRGKPTDVELRLLDVVMPERYEGMKTTQLSAMIHEMMAADLGEDETAG